MKVSSNSKKRALALAARTFAACYPTAPRVVGGILREDAPYDDIEQNYGSEYVTLLHARGALNSDTAKRILHDVAECVEHGPCGQAASLVVAIEHFAQTKSISASYLTAHARDAVSDLRDDWMRTNAYPEYRELMDAVERYSLATGLSDADVQAFVERELEAALANVAATRAATPTHVALTTLPTESAARKAMPIASGVFDYFPAVFGELARLSKDGNDKHNPGQPLHHSRGVSDDHDDCLLRHFVERGSYDDDGHLHRTKIVWRAMAALQLELEQRGLAPVAVTPRPFVMA